MNFRSVLFFLWVFITSVLIVRAAPDFTTSVVSGCAPLAVQFSFGLSDDIESLQWDINNDGSPEYTNLVVVTHTYTQPGVYSVKLVIKKNDGTSDSLVKHNYIRVGNVFQAQVSTNTINCTGELLQIQTTVIGGTKPYTYRWKADGLPTVYTDSVLNVIVDSSVVWRFSVTDATGCTREQIIPVPIKSTLPRVDIMGETIFCEGEKAVWKAIVTGGLPPYTYHWLSRAFATKKDSVIEFYPMQAGDYWTLTVTDALGRCGSKRKVIDTVHRTPSKPILTLTFNVLTSSTAPAYQWYRNGHLILGATNRSIVLYEIGLYKVEISDSNGCKNMSDEVLSTFFVGKVGAEQPEGWAVYPSPVQSELTLHRKEVSGVVELRLDNVVGVSCWQKYLESDEDIHIDMNALPEGVYMLNIIETHRSHVYKIVKQ